MGFGEILSGLRGGTRPRRQPRDEHLLASDAVPKKTETAASADPFEKQSSNIDERVDWIRRQVGIKQPHPEEPLAESTAAKRRKQAEDVDRMFILKSWVDLENESARNAEPPKPPERSSE